MKKASSSSAINSRRGRRKPSMKHKKEKNRNIVTCGICFKGFSALEPFLRHRRANHPGGGSYHEDEVKDKNICRGCDRSFDNSTACSNHYCPSPSPERQGDDENKKTCSICSRSFYTSRGFYHHQRNCYRAEDEEEISDVDDNIVPWLAGGSQEYLARTYAVEALSYLNKDSNIKYKLVKPGAHQTRGIGGGPIVHFNFKAKPKDCPDAPIETFFAQLRMHPPLGPRTVDCCVSLGYSQDVPNWREANTHGCRYCPSEVHHPNPADPTLQLKCPKLITGVYPNNGAWLYGFQ